MMWKLVCLLALAACAGDDDSGGGNGPPPPNTGFVAISSYRATQSSTPIVGGGASASFTMNTNVNACTDTMVAGCDVYVCQAPGPTTYVSGGTVTITGLTQAVTMMPASDKMYAPVSSQQALYTGGETITVNATGADAPAFTLSLTAPARASITAPAKPSSGGLTIDRAHDFAVSWTGGGGKVYLYISGPSGTNSTISCGFDASAGTGTIPAAALMMVPAGTGSFNTSSLSVKSTDIGDWRFYAQAFFTNVWATDTSMATAAVTLQ
ncbi:MAG TPA: hypothetical protein VL326_20785 [Kofleriaceae bacterium]|nr:hypothetical protein [Kofleriaceae bacterium]